MEIYSTQYAHSAHNIQGQHRSATAKEAPITDSNHTNVFKDEVSFSDEALRLSDVSRSESSSANVRFDLINRIKSEIAAGTYDTPDKMDIAVSRMIGSIR